MLKMCSIIGGRAHQKHRCHTCSCTKSRIPTVHFLLIVVVVIGICYASKACRASECSEWRQDRQTWNRARAVYASSIRGRTAISHLFVPGWTLCKQKTVRWMSFRKHKPLQSLCSTALNTTSGSICFSFLLRLLIPLGTLLNWENDHSIWIIFR